MKGKRILTIQMIAGALAFVGGWGFRGPGGAKPRRGSG